VSFSPQSVAVGFHRLFRAAPEVIVRAPGRVNLIGEHTDYNDGLALPMAIDAAIWIAVALRSDGACHVHSTGLGQATLFRIDDGSQPPAWARYVHGVVTLLRERGARLPGCNILIDGDLPSRAGLASSAAVTAGLLLALAEACGEPLLDHERIELCQTCEHRFAGVPCGVLDPTAILTGKAGQALWLDCRSGEVDYTPLPDDACAWLLIDSGGRRELADGRYAARQADCRRAVDYFRRITPGFVSLRDATPELVRAHALQMDPLAAARARHVCSENERVRQAFERLRAIGRPTPPDPNHATSLRDHLVALGRLLRASHESLRDDYEVTSPELDQLADLLAGLPGVYGARMTGAGFGGAVLAAVNPRMADAVMGQIAPRLPVGSRGVRRVRPSDGARLFGGST
jgi:galactokinase